MERIPYIREANRQLDNTEFYKKLPNDTTELNKTKVNTSIEELKALNLMEEKTANNLKSSEAKISQFKMFPKIHKKENPSRPVVTSVDCHTTKISKHVDHLLQPHVKELRSYVKISRDFMRKINNLERIPENRIFVTMDVRSLYTKIPNNDCIKAVETTPKRKTISTRISLHFSTLF